VSQRGRISFLGKHTGKSDPVCAKRKKKNGALKKTNPTGIVLPQNKN
jgi:hypothetical protein